MSSSPSGRSLRVPLQLFGGDETLRAEAAAAFPDCRFHREGGPLRGAELAAFLGEAELTIVGAEPIDRALLAACPNLRAIGKFGVGLDSVDLAACREAGVHVGWTGGVNRTAVAELALGLMISSGRDLFRSALRLREGLYRREPSRSLFGSTVGIVGFGYIGRALVPLLRPFDCEILVNDVLDVSEAADALGVRVVDKAELYRSSDFVTLHLPLTADTRNLIDARALSAFKPGAILVNTARGGIVDETALLAALQEGRLGGAALDVLAVEPPVELSLAKAERAVVTPHIGASSRAAILAMGRSALDHLRRFDRGEPGPDAARTLP